MKRIAAVGILTTLLALGTARSAPAEVGFSIGVQAPGFGAVVTNGRPYAPYPVYVPYPAYAQPYPVYVEAPVVYPRPRYYRGYHSERGGRGHHKRYKHSKRHRGCD